MTRSKIFASSPVRPRATLPVGMMAKWSPIFELSNTRFPVPRGRRRAASAQRGRRRSSRRKPEALERHGPRSLPAGISSRFAGKSEPCVLHTDVARPEGCGARKTRTVGSPRVEAWSGRRAGEPTRARAYGSRSRRRSPLQRGQYPLRPVRSKIRSSLSPWSGLPFQLGSYQRAS